MRAAAILVALTSACAQPMYRWGDYDQAVYHHYRNPADHLAFVEELGTIIRENEQGGARMPPGCYAEYGWALYEEGRFQEASAFFEKEQKAWPESGVLMQKMIALANRSRSPGNARPAGVTR